MKIALCFSGAIRDFDTCIPTIKKYLIQNTNTDIFLHLWESTESTDITYNFKWRNDTVDKNRVIDLLKPKKYVIDIFNKAWENKIITESNIDITKFKSDDDKNYGFNCCSMYYKIYQCYKLVEEYSRENNIIYDIIIRARLDFIWEDYINFDNFDTNKLYLVKDRYATSSKLITNDKFFAGSPLIMQKMSNIFFLLKEYQDKNINIEGQTINTHHIKQHNFQIVWLGNENTYYKCMGRHKIKYKNKTILINNNLNQYNDIINEINYILLFTGYQLFYKDNDNSYNTYFINYNKYKSDINYNFTFIFSEDTNYFIININNNNIKIKKTIINQFKYLSEFILSLIENNINDNFYLFDSIQKIDDIKNNDKIIYKYMDRGYYLLNLIIEDNNYFINFMNTKKKITRNTFSIKNIYNYYQMGFLPY